MTGDPGIDVFGELMGDDLAVEIDVRSAVEDSEGRLDSLTALSVEDVAKRRLFRGIR